MQINQQHNTTNITGLAIGVDWVNNESRCVKTTWFKRFPK